MSVVIDITEIISILNDLHGMMNLQNATATNSGRSRKGTVVPARKFHWSHRPLQMALIAGILIAVLFALMFIGGKASAKTITVDDDGGADYTRIQDAVENASPGDTVFVYSGVYRENVVVNRTINLTGEDRDSTIIQSNRYRIGINIQADGVGVSGFTVIGNSTAEDFPNNHYGIFSNRSMAHIQNCRIQNSSCGIDVRDNSTCEDLIVENNECGIYIGFYRGWLNNLFINLTIKDNGRGILMWGGMANLFFNTVITNNKESGVGFYGGALDNTFESCVVSNNEYGFVFGESNYRNRILNCTIANNSLDGINITGSGDNTISHCTISNNGGYGIMVRERRGWCSQYSSS